ncbi:MAG: TonB-dependent receptor [Gemmatimonadota bacterium]
MRHLRALLAAVLLTAVAMPVVAQARSVTGTVRSITDGAPVADVNVRLRGSAATVQTNAAGAFSISVPAVSTDILLLTHPEYELAEVELLGRTSVEVILVSSVRFNQYGVQVPRTPLDAEARDGILVFESQDGAYRLWFDMRVQMDGAFFLGSHLNPIGNGVEMRRARIGIKSIFARDWYGEVDMDFADSRADLKDAYLMYTGFEGFSIRAGNFKEVFSLETNTTSRYLTFMERPMVTRAMTPSRHAGIGVSYERPYLFAAGGVHFQDVGGWEEVQNRKDYNADIGVSEGYSFTAKVVGIPFYHETDRGVHLGIAGSYRTPKTHDRVGTVRHDTRGISNINRKKYLDTDRMTDVDHSILAGFEAAGYLRGMRVQGEYNLSDVHLNGDRPTEHFRGFYLFASRMLFGGSYQYNRSDAEFTQPNLGRSWGDVELALRYEYLDFNSRMDGVMGGEGEGITVGVNFYANNNVKLSANYGWMNHDRYAGARGDLFVGTDEDGNLTRDPGLVVEPEGEAGEDFSVFALRAQVTF